jgi:hypothetical protein
MLADFLDFLVKNSRYLPTITIKNSVVFFEIHQDGSGPRLEINDFLIQIFFLKIKKKPKKYVKN